MGGGEKGVLSNLITVLGLSNIFLCFFERALSNVY